MPMVHVNVTHQCIIIMDMSLIMYYDLFISFYIEGAKKQYSMLLGETTVWLPEATLYV